MDQLIWGEPYGYDGSVVSCAQMDKETWERTRYNKLMPTIIGGGETYITPWSAKPLQQVHTLHKYKI